MHNEECIMHNVFLVCLEYLEILEPLETLMANYMVIICFVSGGR